MKLKLSLIISTYSERSYLKGNIIERFRLHVSLKDLINDPSFVKLCVNF